MKTLAVLSWSLVWRGKHPQAHTHRYTRTHACAHMMLKMFFGFAFVSRFFAFLSSCFRPCFLFLSSLFFFRLKRGCLVAMAALCINKKLVGGCVDAAQQLVEVGNRVEMGKSLKPPPQKKNCGPHVAEKKQFCGWFAFLAERKCFLWFLRGRKYFCGLPVALTKQCFERRVYFEPHWFCQQCCKTTVFLKESGLCTENNQYLQKIEFLSDHLAMRPVTGGEMKATRHF